ncbi:MAG: phosphate regulon transcriptional regulator PhoB [Pseudomonadota bacterium]
MAATILIVEDEPDIRDLLYFTMSRAGYSVHAAQSAEDALAMIDTHLPDLALIDWMLPGMSGVELVQRLRYDELTATTPVIMLTARGEEADKLRSFDSGVDDYLTKPFSPRELVARVRALLRRSGEPQSKRLCEAGIEIDLDSHIVRVGDQEIHLGPTEYRLLELLVRHPNRAFDRGQLLDRVWGRGVYVEERTVDVHILRLRKALAPFELDGVIQTIRGVGYRLTT